MTLPKDYRSTSQEQEKLNVLKHQSQILHEAKYRTDTLLEQQNETIRQTEKMLIEAGISPSQLEQGVLPSATISPALRSWAEIVADAEKHIDGPALFTDILSPEEIKLAEKRIAILRGDFDSIYRLDKLDWAICGVAGVLAALVDTFLVQMPKHPGFLGGKASEGGPLANWIREKVNSALSPEEIRSLERENWTPYDPSTSTNLHLKVEGLGPGTHRFQSLGHDPLLGFLIGAKDILRGTFTAIDKTGRLIVQPVAIEDPTIFTMNLFDAIGRVFGHLKSDIATPAGLPVPLMPLFQFLQFGDIGKSGYTVGEISRIMYRSHYDFRHFLAMSVSTLMIEIIVRLFYFAKRMHEGYTVVDSIPFELSLTERRPKLHTMLFSAHLIATAANAGKVAVSQNPLTINYSQWLAFFGYAIPQVKWVLFNKENERLRFVQEVLDRDWAKIDNDLKATWSQIAGTPVLLA